MTELVGHPWNRFGHRRVYFKTCEGVRVGWVDCIAGIAHVEDEAFAAEFAAAVSSLIPSPRVPPAQDVPLPTTLPASLVRNPLAQGDLALNRPGQQVAEQERIARRAAPIYSRLARLCGLESDDRPWRVGRQGEEAVAARLARLPADWRVLHSIEVGSKGRDIDHLAIGPGGVYTINAKHHPDAAVWVGGDCFMVNGHRQPYVHKSRHEAAGAARVLSQHAGFPVPVVGVIAVMGARKGFTVKEQPTDGSVQVLTRKQIDEWLRRRRAVLDTAQVSAIFSVARCPQIWTG